MFRSLAYCPSARSIFCHALVFVVVTATWGCTQDPDDGSAGGDDETRSLAFAKQRADCSDGQLERLHLVIWNEDPLCDDDAAPGLRFEVTLDAPIESGQTFNVEGQFCSFSDEPPCSPQNAALTFERFELGGATELVVDFSDGSQSSDGRRFVVETCSMERCSE